METSPTSADSVTVSTDSVESDADRRLLLEKELVVAARPLTTVEERLAEREEELHWFRRFFTQLAVGNGAAFAAISAGVLQADNIQPAAKLGLWPLVFFGFGTTVAGVIPGLLWLDKTAQSWNSDKGWTGRFRWAKAAFWRRWTWQFVMAAYIAAVAASVFFVAGVVAVVFAVRTAAFERPDVSAQSAQRGAGASQPSTVAPSKSATAALEGPVPTRKQVEVPSVLK